MLNAGMLIIAVATFPRIVSSYCSSDEASIRHTTRVAGPIRGTACQIAKGHRRCRPRLAGFGIDPIVAVARAVSQPTCVAAVGHCDGHPRAPWRRHVPERRPGTYVAECPENVVRERQSETAEQHGSRRDPFVPGRLGDDGGSERQASVVAGCLLSILGCSAGRYPARRAPSVEGGVSSASARGICERPS